MTGAHTRPGLHHPLMGARLGLLLRSLAGNGPIPLRRWPLVGAMLASAVARAPIALVERTVTARAVRRGPGLDPPVFIIGHWRSGTTHLHNLMARSPALGWISPLATGIPGEILTLGAWLRPLLERALPEDRLVDRVAVTPDSPQPDEIPLANMQTLSVFHALYFPRRFREHFERGVFIEGCTPREIERWRRLMVAFLGKIAAQQGRATLIIKNESYTARVAALRAIWPGARFIHVHRNPFEVYVSTVNYYRRLLPTLALQPFDRLDIESFVLETYPRVMSRCIEETSDLPADQFIEVGYDEIASSPMGVLARIHESLGLPGWATAGPRAEAYLASIRGYRRNEFRMAPGEIERVRVAWGEYIARWGYSAPASLTDGAGGAGS